MAETDTIPTRPDINSSAYVTAMSHFYRGELSRIMVWRQRLDVTTTWAITCTTTLITVAFSLPALPHIIFFFNIAIVFMMLWIEARRYRFYDAFRARVRMLEAHFLVPLLLQNQRMLEGDWRKLVCEDLILPSFKIGVVEAVGRRMKRNYVFLFAIILVAWLTKIFIHAEPKVRSVGDFYRALGVAHFPAWLVATLLVLTYGAIIWFTVYVARNTSGEVNEFGGSRPLWRI